MWLMAALLGILLALCTAKGYSGSGMPPRDSGTRTCSCYDAEGREAVKAPLEETSPGGRK